MENIPHSIEVKYRFRGLNNIIFDGKNLYRLAHVSSGGRFLKLKKYELKIHCGSLKYRIYKTWYTKDQLNSISYKSIETIELIKLPF